MILSQSRLIDGDLLYLSKVNISSLSYEEIVHIYGRALLSDSRLFSEVLRNDVMGREALACWIGHIW